MCGIAGYTGPSVDGLLQLMNDRMIHRGPDDEGYFETPDIHLAMRRLQILDPQLGKQPQFNGDHTIVAFMNGEIYNYVELRRELETQGYKFLSNNSDTEVLAHLFEREGPTFVRRLNGMFAICIYDLRHQTLFLFRDRIGKKPLYYSRAEDSGDLFFASEFNVFETKRTVENLNLDSLAWYFSQKTTPTLESIDKRIHKVPPGHYLSFDKNKNVKMERYYPFPSPARAADDRDLVSRLENLLLDSVKIRMRSDVEVGAFLSGGVDSSLVVAMASQLTTKPLKTYCLIYEDEIYNKKSDQSFAKLVSDTFRTDHREVLLTPARLMEDLPKIARQHGQPNSATLSAWFIADAMKKDITVALSGDGADELFGSYFTHRISAALLELRQNRQLSELHYLTSQEFKFLEKSRDLPLFQIIDQFAVFSDAEIAKLLKPGYFEAGSVVARLSRLFSDLSAPREDLLAQMLEFDCRNALVNQILHYSDLLAMAHSIEVRCPFLDYRLVELAFGAPATARIHNGHTKILIKRVAEKYLPKELVHRAKEGFIEPGILWLQDHLKDFCMEKLNSAQFNRSGLLNKAYVTEILTGFYGSHDFFLGKKVWSLLMYALWEESYYQ